LFSARRYSRQNNRFETTLSIPIIPIPSVILAQLLSRSHWQHIGNLTTSCQGRRRPRHDPAFRQYWYPTPPLAVTPPVTHAEKPWNNQSLPQLPALSPYRSCHFPKFAEFRIAPAIELNKIYPLRTQGHQERCWPQSILADVGMNQEKRTNRKNKIRWKVTL
jgi:hypothetical protein